MDIEPSEMAHLTEDYGDAWALNHSRRLLALIDCIGEGLDYNHEAIWLSAYLHDWGAYAPWKQADVDHALRSRQVADAFLDERGCPAELKALVLECIELHHEPGSERSLESVLLRDADALDFLGTAGILRIFAKNPRNMRKGYEEAHRRRETLPGIISLGKAQEMAAQRVAEMDALLAQFEVETFGYF